MRGVLKGVCEDSERGVRGCMEIVRGVFEVVWRLYEGCSRLCGDCERGVWVCVKIVREVF